MAPLLVLACQGEGKGKGSKKRVKVGWEEENTRNMKQGWDSNGKGGKERSRLDKEGRKGKVEIKKYL